MNKPASIYYDKLAKYYEHATSAEGAWTPPQMIQKFVGVNVTSSSLVLDIGIGTGQSCSFLKHTDENPKIYGIDISAEMLAICQEKHPEIEVFYGTLEEFRNKNNLRFNLIISSGALEFIEDLSSIFESVKSLISKDGRFVFTFEPLIVDHPIQSNSKSLVIANSQSSLYVKDFYTYRRTIEEVMSSLSSAGFKVDRKEDFVAYQKEGSNINYAIFEATLRANQN